MERMRCLDGLRGLLAVYVLVSHMAPFAALPGWLGEPFSHGEAAVDVFFMLSGMVIVGSLESFGHRPGPFLAARAARLMPVFLVVFPLALVVQAIPAGFERMPWIGLESAARKIWSEGWPLDWGPEIAAHLSMTHGLFPDGVLPGVWMSFLGAAWSLSTEWQFYAVMALLAAWKQDQMEGLAWLFLAISALAVAWQWVAPADLRFTRAFLPNKAQYFALGVAAAGLARVRSPDGRRAYAAVLAASLILCAAQGGIHKLGAPLLWTVCVAAQLVPRNPWLSRLALLLTARPLLWLGGASYCIYLVNEPLQKVLGVVLAAATCGQALLFTAIWLPAAVLLPIGAAWWLHRHVEQPSLRWGQGKLRALAPAGAG